ncbi:MAG: hypothetical protein ACQEQU_04030 [Spirochaetota bacterium]
MHIRNGFTPGKKRWKKLYVSCLLRFLGRAMQRASCIDTTIQQEAASLPDEFTISLYVYHSGPGIIMKKQPGGRLQYCTSSKDFTETDLCIIISHIEAAWLLLTFKESTAQAVARDRIRIRGSIALGSQIVRILDRVEMLLLPRLLAKRAVKRYVSPRNKFRKRFQLYFGTYHSRGVR